MIIKLKLKQKPKSASFQNFSLLENHKAFIEKYIEKEIASEKEFEHTPEQEEPTEDITSDVNLSMVKIQEEIQNAYNQGFNDGQQTTTAAFQAQIQQHQKWLRNIDSVILELRQQYSQIIAELENQIIDLAIEIAKHILQTEALNNSEIVIQQARKAIKELDDDVIFSIKLNPENINILRKAKSEIINDTALASKVKLIPDNSIEPGGCILETSAGTIYATLESQLEKVRNSLKNNLLQNNNNREEESNNTNSIDS